MQAPRLTLSPGPVCGCTAYGRVSEPGLKCLGLRYALPVRKGNCPTGGPPPLRRGNTVVFRLHFSLASIDSRKNRCTIDNDLNPHRGFKGIEARPTSVPRGSPSPDGDRARKGRLPKRLPGDAVKRWAVRRTFYRLSRPVPWSAIRTYFIFFQRIEAAMALRRRCFFYSTTHKEERNV